MGQQNNQEPGSISDQRSSGYAPWYPVPELSVVNVEHPFIIENIETALDMLGGVSHIRSLIKDENRAPPAALRLRPRDPMCKSMSSNKITTNDVVLKVTAPKRTGLKRRRGALGPYHEGLGDDDTTKVLKDTRYMLRSLRDNAENYRIEPLGSIHKTHRFRNLPDFVFSTASSPFMTKMRDVILPFEYEKLKDFKIDMSRGPRKNMDLIPPPRWSHLTIPFNYSYLQNPAAKQIVDGGGNVILKNTQIQMPTQNQPVPYDVQQVPSHPSKDLPPITSLEPAMQRLIHAAQRLFDERPIWTRRALRNRLPEADWKKVGDNSAKYIHQYVGYLWASGPWRDAVVTFGIDPRKDARYRHYQTMMFVIGSQSRRDISTTKPSPRESHVFDGITIAPDGKLYQVCDVLDPLLVSILSNTNVRDKCHIYGDGWFLNGTWAKTRVIMKAKITSLLCGIKPNDSDYQGAVTIIPDNLDESNRQAALLPRRKENVELKKERALLAQIRTHAWKSLLDERNQGAGRLKEKKMKSLPKAVTGEEGFPDDGNEIDEEEEGEDADGNEFVSGSEDEDGDGDGDGDDGETSEEDGNTDGEEDGGSH